MTFKIATKEGIQEIKGDALKIAKRRCFISQDNLFEHFTITHAETGMLVCSDFSKETAIKKAEKLFASNHNFLRKAVEELKFNGIDYPVNK